MFEGAVLNQLGKVRRRRRIDVFENSPYKVVRTAVPGLSACTVTRADSAAWIWDSGATLANAKTAKAAVSNASRSSGR
jgi:hypothetical protein